MDSRTQDLLRAIPSVEAVLRELDVGPRATLPRPMVVTAAREATEVMRERVISGAVGLPDTAEGISRETLALATERVRVFGRRRLVPLLNATGIIVHTNLGRAPLSEDAVAAVTSTASGYTNVEYDLERGERGGRGRWVKELICELTGGEDALVVNNNAAAVLLALNTLAAGREAVVARGELIEIGGSFRLPEVFEKSGATMVAVGTTNRTRIDDYARAMRNTTAVLLTAHWSNYEITGFVDRVGLRQLAELAERVGVPVVYDMGSGAVSDLPLPAGAGVSTVRSVLQEGASIATFSGDKLLGGPQAGVIVGSADLVRRMRENPLRRALRPGKLTLAALGATLGAHVAGRSDSIPVVYMMSASRESLRRRADRVKEKAGHYDLVSTVDCTSLVGGGSGASLELASAGIEIECRRVHDLFHDLLRSVPPVVSRISGDKIIIDMRTIRPSDDEQLAAVLTEVLERADR